MAREITITLTSDLSGAPDAHTIEFTIENRKYEIDLTTEETAELYRILTPYTDAARVRTGGRGTGKPASTRPARQHLPAPTATIRAWATARGLTVPARGRMPKNIIEQYEQAEQNT